MSPGVTTFSRDVFISYDSDDLPWAERMKDGLATRGLTSFVARRDIVAGPGWEVQVVDALNACKHFLVLCSAQSKESSWVLKELNRFQAAIDPTGRGSADRFLVQVLLDEADFSAYSSLQVVPDIKEAGLYAGGAGAVGAVLWDHVVDAVVKAYQVADGSLPVPVLVVSTTAAELAGVDVDHKPPDAPTLRELLTHLGLQRDDLVGCYGDTVRAWRPFGSAATIEEILLTMNQDINGSAARAGRPFRWDYVDGDFWSSGDRVDIAAARLTTGPAVVVVDALSLYVELVRSRFPSRVYRAFDNDEALFLVPAPFPVPPGNLHLRALVQGMARQVFDHSFEPPVLLGPYARCGATIADERDLKAWVLTGLGPRLRAPAPSGGTPFLGHGGPP